MSRADEDVFDDQSLAELQRRRSDALSLRKTAEERERVAREREEATQRRREEAEQRRREEAEQAQRDEAEARRRALRKQQEELTRARGQRDDEEPWTARRKTGPVYTGTQSDGMSTFGLVLVS